MSLIKRVDLMAEDQGSRGREVAGALFKQFNEFHSADVKPDYEIENLLLRQKEFELSLINHWPVRPAQYIFSPSGASKCERELYYKALKTEMIDEKFPYQRRWTRNSSAVHEVVQRDLLYMSKMENAPFKVHMLENGLPAWEQNLKTHKLFLHNCVDFAVLGMMDGILEYKDGSRIGFEFKTKSNSIGQVGNYKMKDIAEPHKQQCIAYSLLFGIDEFILMYESVAKDGWSKGAEAKTDIRTFYYNVTEEDRQALLNKFADVVESVQAGTPPEGDFTKCIFCPYKHLCN